MVRLGEDFARLGKGRLLLGEPMTVLRPVFIVAQFVIVCGLLRDHCMTCLRVSLFD